MAFSPVLPNIQADIAGGPKAGLADVRNTFGSTLASAESMLPAAVATPLATIRGKINSALASVETKLPAGNPFPPAPPTPEQTQMAVGKIVGQTSLQGNIDKQVGKVYTGSGM